MSVMTVLQCSSPRCVPIGWERDEVVSGAAATVLVKPPMAAVSESRSS